MLTCEHCKSMQAKTQLTQSYGTVDFEIHQKSRAKNAKNAIALREAF